MSNVILFPKSKSGGPPETMDELLENITSNRKEQIEVLMQELVPDLMSMLESYGIDLNQNEYIKDTAMVVETLSSALHRYFGIPHQFHDLINNSFTFTVNADNTINYEYSGLTLDETTEEET